MNCNEFRTRLAIVIESHEPCPDDRNRLEEHARRCPHADCQQIWADEALLSAVLPVWRESVPQAALAGRVVSQLKQSRGGEVAEKWVSDHRPPAVRGTVTTTSVIRSQSLASPPAGRLWLAVATSVAALLLIVPLLRMEERPADTVVSATALPGESPAVPTADGTLEQETPATISEVAHAYAKVPQTATAFVTDTAVLLLPTDRSDPNEQPSRPARWLSRLSQQIEPWGRDLESAFDALLDTVAEPAESSQYEPAQKSLRLVSV